MKSFNEIQQKILDLLREGVSPESSPSVARDSAGYQSIDESQISVASVASVASPPSQPIRGFKLGASSMRELVGVDNRLTMCVQLAIRYSTQDFTVYDGIRTLKEQQEHVQKGTSKTMQSKHLKGLAVDLVPWIGGVPVWDWDGCYRIAHAMDIAATELKIAHLITWGGAWDRRLSDFGSDLGSYEQEVKLYRIRHEGKDFIDGPHFELTV